MATKSVCCLFDTQDWKLKSWHIHDSTVVGDSAEYAVADSYWWRRNKCTVVIGSRQNTCFFSGWWQQCRDRWRLEGTKGFLALCYQHRSGGGHQTWNLLAITPAPVLLFHVMIYFFIIAFCWRRLYLIFSSFLFCIVLEFPVQPCLVQFFLLVQLKFLAGHKLTTGFHFNILRAFFLSYFILEEALRQFKN